jgi:HEAT repeat protein
MRKFGPRISSELEIFLECLLQNDWLLQRSPTGLRQVGITAKPRWAWLPLILALASPILAAEVPNEQQLIQILQSDAGPKEKDAACSKLKRIATAASVPAVAALLTDEQLSHSARYVLEPMPMPEAGAALIEALGKTSGQLRIGIIDSLGVRREPNAATPLAKMLGGEDGGVAIAAAAALGKIATPEAVAALEAVPASASAALHSAVVDAMLNCGLRLLATDRRQEALAIFQRIFLAEKSPNIRQAAFTGFVRSSGDRALQLTVNALAGDDPVLKRAALGLVPELNAPLATRDLAEVLPKLDSHTQAALISALSARGDTDAATAIGKLAQSQSVEVRTAAVKALGQLGDASVLPLLANAAAAAAGDDVQPAARQALLTLHRGDVTAAIVAELPTASKPVQAELSRALAGRHDRSAAARLLELAQKENSPGRAAALQALPSLVSEAQLADLVHLVSSAKTDAGRTEAADAFLAACRQLRTRQPTVDPSALVGQLNSGSTAVRLALLPAASGFADAHVRDALRKRVADKDPKVHEAAIRAMCATLDPELLGDLLKLAKEAPAQNIKSMAVSACVRLATQEESVHLSPAQRLDTLRALLNPPPGADQKRVVLSGLAEVPGLGSLKLIQPMLADNEVRTEAVRAAIKASAAIGYRDSAAAQEILKEVLDAARDDNSKKAVESALGRLEAAVDFIVDWQATGAFRQEGKDYSALFDIPFGPELPDARVQWRALTPGGDVASPVVMDLLAAIGGEQCVAYARTWIFSPADQPATMELGSDDGVKVWVGDKLVHSHNVARAVQPASDKVKVELKQGWNRVLLKVTQYNQGWGFCLRLVKPDGSRLTGLKVDPAHG